MQVKSKNKCKCKQKMKKLKKGNAERKANGKTNMDRRQIKATDEGNVKEKEKEIKEKRL